MTEPAHPATRATVDAYLARIGVDHVGPPTQASLARLQQAHMLYVPFESLSIGWGEQIELDETWLLDKIVGRRRGGFCYELNGAFAWLLRQLGFHVDMLEAQVWSAEAQTFSPPFDHMTLAVRADDATHLVDVGFGRAPRAPMRWPEDRQTGVDGVTIARGPTCPWRTTTSSAGRWPPRWWLPAVWPAWRCVRCRPAAG